MKYEAPIGNVYVWEKLDSEINVSKSGSFYFNIF